jgi:hypothetical protein
MPGQSGSAFRSHVSDRFQSGGVAVAKLEVVIAVNPGNRQATNSEEVDGDKWEVDAGGVLTIFDEQNRRIASFPDGKWWRILRK